MKSQDRDSDCDCCCNNFGNRPSIEDARRALDSIFTYFASRDGVELNKVIPSKSRGALHLLMHYYRPLIKKAIALRPCDHLWRVCEPRDLFSYVWNEFWRYAPRIKNRSIEGVGKWLQMVIHHRRIRLRKKHAREFTTTAYFDHQDENSYTWLRHAGLATTDEECAFRFQLLHEFYAEGMECLNDRQRVILQLSEERSDAEILKKMQFRSIDAVKAFKKRARHALANEVIRLFQRDLTTNSKDTTRREIIEEWLDRFGPKNPLTQTIIFR